MGITVNVENIEFLREPIDRALAKGKAEGKAEGLAEGLVLALDIKFGVIPPRLPQLLAKLEPANLEAMMARVRAAASLEEVLGQTMPADTTISKD